MRSIRWNTAQDRPHLSESGIAGSLNILIAEDHPSTAEVLGLYFRGEGHEVTVVYDGDQAVNAVRRQQPDLIIMDLGMPEMNGIQAAREIRKIVRAGHPCIVALSAYDQIEDVESCWEAGFDAHLSKPVGPDALSELMGQLGNRAHAGLGGASNDQT